MRAITELRALTPERPLSIEESLRVAELQATHLLRLMHVTAAPVEDGVVTELPRVRVREEAGLPVSGSSHWVAGVWVITVNRDEPPLRRRFTAAHELKHALDAPFIHFLYPAEAGLSSAKRAERVADYFAACVLMPRPWVKRVFGQGIHDVEALASRFQVSAAAMRYRLDQLGLSEPPQQRCGAAA